MTGLLDPILRGVLPAAVVGNGLLAGLFYGFSCSVVPGFRSVDDRTYVSAFRAINAAILNPWFLPVFVGTPIVTVAAAVLAGNEGRAGVGMVGAAAFSVATFLITAGGSVPLNSRLEGDRSASDAEARRRFEGRWGLLNLWRTLSSTAALACLAVSLPAGLRHSV